ncbi:MAG: hypothetical protein IT352_15950 [Gemmatimonadales bacterium]|nr:hypothetical protein [Gemmatimonadales bacterium]
MGRHTRFLGIVAALALGATSAGAQQGSITGKVTDQANGQALTGARV